MTGDPICPNCGLYRNLCNCGYIAARNKPCLECNQPPREFKASPGEVTNHQFKREAAYLCNRYGWDNVTNTPDFILGEAIFDFLTTYHKIVIGNLFHQGIESQIEEAKRKEIDRKP